MSLLDGFFHKRSVIALLDPLTISVAGRTVTITLRHHDRARRMTLRMDRRPDSAVITLPRRVGRTEALRFAEKSVDWIAGQLECQPASTAIAHGAEVLFRGNPHTVISTGTTRGLVIHDQENAALFVPGAPSHVKRRLVDWLKAQARRELVTACTHYAGRMGVAYTAISIRDQKSRWGSCAASGALSFSWRLILAPDYVLDYVAAHEVAHLSEMNHSPRFWRLVLTHCPHTKRAKAWLKQHGRELHRVG
jgi:predicted metal-dependent hydrolase